MNHRSERKLSNVRLTKKYHFLYLGTWVIMTSALLVTINVLLYAVVRQKVAGLDIHESLFREAFRYYHATVLVAMAIEVALLIFAIVTLARFTAHRIAGPYIRLRNVFGEVKDGNMNVRLKFRNTDHLEEVEEAFNDMMDVLRKEAGSQNETPAP